jgi:hypothetical protein
MKKIIITMSTLIAISCTTQKDIYDDYKTLNIVINDIEDYIEWLNEDLFQGNVTQEEYDVMKENYEETLTLSKELKS